MPIRHFTDLQVWQKAHSAALDVFRLSADWPGVERFALTDQIRRSARSVGANISEAWAKRRYPAAFVAKLVDADGEGHETEHWLINAEAHGYVSKAQLTDLKTRYDEIGRMIGGMIARPEAFMPRPRLEPCTVKRPDLRPLTSDS